MPSGINSSGQSTQDKTRLITKLISNSRKKRNLNLGSSSKNSSITQDRWAAAAVRPTKRQLLQEFANFASFKAESRRSQQNLSSERSQPSLRSDVSEGKTADDPLVQRSKHFRASLLASKPLKNNQMESSSSNGISVQPA